VVNQFLCRNIFLSATAVMTASTWRALSHFTKWSVFSWWATYARKV